MVVAQRGRALWNIQNLGWGEHKQYEAAAEIAALFDFIAVQEVMSASAIERLRETLEARTEEP